MRLGRFFTYTILLLAFCILPFSIAADASTDSIESMNHEQLQEFVTHNHGKVVLVNFWATWCGPCLMEMPGLVQMRSEVSADKLAMVNVSLDYDPGALALFVEGLDTSIPNYLAEQELVDTLKIQAIPMMLLYDTDGTIVVSHMGYMSPEELRETVAEYLPSE